MKSQDNQENQEIQTDTMISVRDAYLALYYFVNAYFVRGGRRDDEQVVLLLNEIGPRERGGQVETNDPAFWNDWLHAVETARREGFPNEDQI